MSSQTPPPVPDPNSAFRTYLRAVAVLIPTIFFWLFAMLFLVPKLEQIWQIAGLTDSKAQWLMDASDGLKQNSRFIVGGIVLVLLLLEFRWPAWPRYRRVVVGGFTLFFHTAVLFGITTIAVAVCVAAPLLAKQKRPANKGAGLEPPSRTPGAVYARPDRPSVSSVSPNESPLQETPQ